MERALVLIPIDPAFIPSTVKRGEPECGTLIVNAYLVQANDVDTGCRPDLTQTTNHLFISLAFIPPTFHLAK